MGQDISLSCQCGAFQAVLHNITPQNGNHAICYCRDCRAFARHLGADYALDDHGGTALFQSQPHRIEITKGADQLALLKMSKKGLYRWHTSCCNTPLGTTVATPKFAFFGVVVANLASPEAGIGPVLFRYKPDQALKPVSDPGGSLLRFFLRTMRNALRDRLNGKWRDTPFFDIETGRAVVKPYVLSEAERDAAYCEPVNP